MRQKMKLSELFDAKVSHLSLVDAGANRTPFKIEKAEKGGEAPMLNFKDVFKDEPFVPSVLAVAVADGADIDVAKKLIEEAGFNTEIQKDVDGATVFLQSENAIESARGQVIKAQVDKSLAVVCDVAKGFSPFTGSTEFETNLSGLGFIPSLELASDALRTTVFEIMVQADDNISAAGDVKKATSAFAKHVTELVENLPSEVFKLEGTIQKADLNLTIQVNEGLSVPPTTVVDQVTDQEFDSDDGVDKGTNQSVNKDEGDTNVEPEKDEEESELTQVLKAIEGLGGKVKELDTKVDEKIAELETQVGEAVKKAEEADAAATGRVIGEANEDDTNRETVRHSDPPLIDTGMASLLS